MASLLRQLSQADITCPAGAAVGDASVLCRVENSLLDGARNPHSIEAYCAGCYMDCPSWRADRDAVLAGRKLDLRKRTPPRRTVAVG